MLLKELPRLRPGTTINQTLVTLELSAVLAIR